MNDVSFKECILNNLATCKKNKQRSNTVHIIVDNYLLWCIKRIERCALIITWTICRGWTESVGKFPRPWTGTVSPRIESKRCTCSQDNTQNRRHCSDTSPEDMAMERTTSLKKAKTSGLLLQRMIAVFPSRLSSYANSFVKNSVISQLHLLSAIYKCTGFARSSSCACDSLFPIHARPRQATSTTVSLETKHPNGLYTQEICIRASYWLNVGSFHSTLWLDWRRRAALTHSPGLRPRLWSSKDIVIVNVSLFKRNQKQNIRKILL